MTIDTSQITVFALAAVLLARGVLGEAGKDLYHKLKDRLGKLVGKGDVESLASDPESKPRRDVLAEALAKAGAGDDAELSQLAAALAREIKQADAAAGGIGLDVNGIEAVNMVLENVTGTHTGAKVQNARLTGDFTAKGVHGGDRSGN
jgi:hypothetical protein